MQAATKRFEIWLKGLFATGISGASGGIPTGLAAVGISSPATVQAYRKTTKQISTAGPLARRFSLTARPISYIMLTTK